MIFRKKKPPETPTERFERILAFNHDMVKTGTDAIDQLKATGPAPLALANHSHLIHDLSYISVMLWRNGQDPRETIRQAHEVHGEMVSYRSQVDPNRLIPMDQIAGITDWDLVYSLFLMIGKKEIFHFHFPEFLSERYFAYSRFILHQVFDTKVPDELSKSVKGFSSQFDELVDQNFHDLHTLLNDDLPNSEVEAVVARVDQNWLARKDHKFYKSSAPILAGSEISNELCVNYQLACILRKTSVQRSLSMHQWCWD